MKKIKDVCETNEIVSAIDEIIFNKFNEIYEACNTIEELQRTINMFYKDFIYSNNQHLANYIKAEMDELFRKKIGGLSTKQTTQN